MEWRTNMFCWKCGKQIPDRSQFCINCGAKIPLQEPNKEEPENLVNTSSIDSAREYIEFYIKGHRLEYDKNIQEYTDRRKKHSDAFKKNIFPKAIELINSIKNLPDSKIDDCLDMIYQFGENTKDWLIAETHKCLLADKIYSVSREQLATLFSNSATQFSTKYDEFSEKYLLIVAGEEKLKQYKAQQRANRSRWEGGGFGVKSAIKGAITAGAMNIGTDLIRGIGDAWVDSKDRNEILAKKKELLGSTNWVGLFYWSLSDDSYCIFDIYVELLSQNEKIVLPTGLNFELAITYYKNSSSINNAEEKTLLLLQCIQAYPYLRPPYKDLFSILGTMDEEVLLVFEYFLSNSVIQEFVDRHYREFIKQLGNYQEKSYQELEEATEYVEKELSQIESHRDSSQFYRQYEETHKKDLEDLLSNVKRQRCTSDDGIEFSSIEELNTYYAERESYIPYRNAMNTKQLPLGQQKSLLAEAKAKKFSSAYIVAALHHWEIQIIGDSKQSEIYQGSFEDYYKRRWEEIDSDEITKDLPEQVKKYLDQIPYISITSFVARLQVKIYPRLLSFSKIDAWILVSDFYIIIVIPGREEKYFYRTVEINRIALVRNETLVIHKNASVDEIKFLLTEGDNGKLYKFIEMINQSLKEARDNMRQALCPACSTPLFPEAKFCGKCGYKINFQR